MIGLTIALNVIRGFFDELNLRGKT